MTVWRENRGGLPITQGQNTSFLHSCHAHRGTTAEPRKATSSRSLSPLMIMGSHGQSLATSTRRPTHHLLAKLSCRDVGEPTQRPHRLLCLAVGDAAGEAICGDVIRSGGSTLSSDLEAPFHEPGQCSSKSCLAGWAMKLRVRLAECGHPSIRLSHHSRT